jgi:pimeloyl-ACP methyl ester carboxylesterase
MIVFAITTLSSCFSRYLYSDKEIEEYYRHKNYKPISHFVCYNDRPLHFVEFGDTTKPLLILIHGAPGAWYTWMNFVDIDSLRENFHLLIVDRPGYGKSNYGKVNKNINDQICSIQAVIDHYPNKEIVLAGRSYGAPIAAALAAINQSRCQNLILYSPVLSPYKEKTYWFSGLGKFFLVQWMLPKALNVATAEKFAHVTQMKQILSYYPQIKANTTIVSGKQDWVAHSSNHRICDSLIKVENKRELLLGNAGHFLTFECPNTMASLIYKPFEPLELKQVELKVAEEMAKTTKKQRK